jgi:hypothetical protein
MAGSADDFVTFYSQLRFLTVFHVIQNIQYIKQNKVLERSYNHKLQYSIKTRNQEKIQTSGQYSMTLHYFKNQASEKYSITLLLPS